MRTPEEVFILKELLPRHEARLLLVDDFLHLLHFPPGQPLRIPQGEAEWQVLLAESNLAFRSVYEPLRRRPGRYLILRRRPDVLLPDVEERASREGAHLRVTPASLLERATDVAWPEEVNLCDALVRERFGEVVEAFAQWRATSSQGFGLEEAMDVLLAAILGVNWFVSLEAPYLWAAFFRHRSLLEEWGRRVPPLGQRLRQRLQAQGPPLSWLAEGRPEVASRTLWLTAWLAQYREDASASLPLLYPAGLWLKGLSPGEAQEFLNRLLEHSPDIADSQALWMDEILAEVGTKVEEVDGGKVLATERYSPFWATVALRRWFQKQAQEGFASFRGTLPPWPHKERLCRLPRAAQSLRLHRFLLEGMEWLEEEGEKAKALAQRVAAEGPEAFPRLWLAFWTEAQGGKWATLLRNLDALLKGDWLYEPRYSSIMPHFARQFVPWAYSLLAPHREGWEEWLEVWEEVASGKGLWGEEGSVFQAMDRILEESLLASSPIPVRVFVVAGLDWTLWSLLQELAPLPHEKVRAVSVPPPGLPSILWWRWCRRRCREEIPFPWMERPLVEWLRWATPWPWEAKPSLAQEEVLALPGLEVIFEDWRTPMAGQGCQAWAWLPFWETLRRRWEEEADKDRWLVGWGGVQWVRRWLPIMHPLVVRLLSPRVALLRGEGEGLSGALFRPEEVGMPSLWPTPQGEERVQYVALALRDEGWTVEGEQAPPSSWAGGGLSPWETVAPVVFAPATRRRWEESIHWEERRRVRARRGEEVVYRGWLVLRHGALAEMVEVAPEAPGVRPITVMLSLGQPRAVEFRLTLPSDVPPGHPFLFPIRLRWGQREKVVMGRVDVERESSS